MAGMNTTDVRNMELTQWVFWAVALPLAVVIIVLCLIWAGELENVWRGFSNLWKGKSGYKRVGGGRDAYKTATSRADMQPASYGDIYDGDYLRPERSYRPIYGRTR